LSKMGMKMNKTKIIIGINIVFIVLIIVAFLPALKSGDDDYNTKTVAVEPAQQEEVTTEEPATEEDVATAPEVDMTEEQAPLATMVEDKVEQAVVATESVVNDAVTSVESTTTASAVEGIYSVVDGNKLDASSYAGFKLYRNWCARCHGTYGQGMVGPDLAESLKFISKEQFYDVVENGKSGRIGSMPSWNANVQVMENMDQLYAYLKARSDGAIGVIKPQKQ
jgi:mono/diheme cytochrome c family protein/nitrogen fixation-related uncharacterized protein